MNPGVACINLAVARAIHDTAPEQTARFTKVRLKPRYEQIRKDLIFFFLFSVQFLQLFFKYQD